MSMEATSGKNPVNHIGKIYNLLAHELAGSVAEEVDGLRQVQIRLLSQIGEPIDRPHVADAEVITEQGVDVSEVRPDIEAAVDAELAAITDIAERVIEGELSTF
jgi:S-adenosylmethionine synthetase